MRVGALSTQGPPPPIQFVPRPTHPAGTLPPPRNSHPRQGRRYDAAMARVPLPEPEPMKLTRLADIARGGMGSVELARVEEGRLAGTVVAIKRLHSGMADDPQFVSMFL